MNCTESEAIIPIRPTLTIHTHYYHYNNYYNTITIISNSNNNHYYNNSYNQLPKTRLIQPNQRLITERQQLSGSSVAAQVAAKVTKKAATDR